jgi:hypothetical protein
VETLIRKYIFVMNVDLMVILLTSMAKSL